jgi:hypothetical protein
VLCSPLVLRSLVAESGPCTSSHSTSSFSNDVHLYLFRYTISVQSLPTGNNAVFCGVDEESLMQEYATSSQHHHNTSAVPLSTVSSTSQLICLPCPQKGPICPTRISGRVPGHRQQLIRNIRHQTLAFPRRKLDLTEAQILWLCLHISRAATTPD